ncbi:MAG: hypothetical protein HDT37_04305 [Clostridiales bacterium]|nr:hypothetical protein [Clostridiales bacterium]
MRDVLTGGNNIAGDVNIVDNSRRATKISISIGSVILVGIIGIVAFFMLRPASIENKILGTWHNDEISDLYMVFSENNSLTVNRSNISMKGTYTFVDDNRLQLNFNLTLLNYVIYADVSVQGKTLSFDHIEDLSQYFFTSSSTTFEKIK